MAKSKKKTVFFCKQCGYESSKWLGQCPGCHTVFNVTLDPAIAASSIVLTNQSGFNYLDTLKERTEPSGR